MNFSHIHHIAIIVSDLEASKTFYCEHLGFTVVNENQRPEKADIKCDLVQGDCHLELFVKADAPKRPSYPEALGLRHLAFKVDDVSDCIADLLDKGINCESIRYDSQDHKAMTFFHDPDGLPIEIHE